MGRQPYLDDLRDKFFLPSDYYTTLEIKHFICNVIDSSKRNFESGLLTLDDVLKEYRPMLSLIDALNFFEIYRLCFIISSVNIKNCILTGSLGWTQK